jgi:hypothetical protein
LTDFMHAYGVTDLVTWGIPPGLTADVMQQSLSRYVEEVIPRLRERLAPGD